MEILNIAVRNYEMMKLLQFGESQIKCTCFLSLVDYIIRDIVTASLLMNVFRSCLSTSYKVQIAPFLYSTPSTLMSF